MKVSSIVEFRFIVHELGHIINLLLFSRINLKYKLITSIEFNPQNGICPAIVRGSSLGQNLFATDNHNLLSEKDYLTPVIIGFASGYIYEQIFCDGSDFLAKLWENGQHNMDGCNTNVLLKRHGNDVNVVNKLEVILKSYSMFIRDEADSIKRLIDFFSEQEFVLNENGSIIIQGEELNILLGGLDNLLPQRLLDSFQFWHMKQPALIE
jgi:hypothetical protein